MVESKLDHAKKQGYVLVCPNMSSRWATTRRFLWAISSFVIFIAMVLSFLGFWLILPFAGLEVMALTSLSYWVAYQCCRKEVIHIQDNRVTVEKGHHAPEFSWSSELFWTRLIILQPGFRGHPVRLILRSKQQRLEIGEFLNEDDKKALIAVLRGVIVVGHQ